MVKYLTYFFIIVNYHLRITAKISSERGLMRCELISYVIYSLRSLKKKMNFRRTRNVHSLKE